VRAVPAKHLQQLSFREVRRVREVAPNHLQQRKARELRWVCEVPAKHLYTRKVREVRWVQRIWVEQVWRILLRPTSTSLTRPTLRPASKALRKLKVRSGCFQAFANIGT